MKHAGLFHGRAHKNMPGSQIVSSVGDLAAERDRSNPCHRRPSIAASIARAQGHWNKPAGLNVYLS